MRNIRKVAFDIPGMFAKWEEEEIMKIPNYWKSSLEDIEETVKSLKKGSVRTVYSAGGRPIYLVEYGMRNEFHRTANFSSACGCHDMSCYADKKKPDTRPCLLLVGATHGAEFEGTVAILNLINLLETGSDFAGNRFPAFERLTEKINLLLIPCLNPDGRARVPFDSVLEMSFEEFRYYAQGTWKDGSLAGWPACKQYHPILDKVDFLGAYYNDNGINIQHDDFFKPMAGETAFLLDIADEYVPDATVLLHGGTNTHDGLLPPTHVPLYFKEQALQISENFKAACEANGMEAMVRGLFGGMCKNDNYPPFYVDLVSAITMKCGELCMVYESNQGLAYGDYRLGYEEIYKHHMLLFQEMIAYVQKHIKELRDAQK